MVYNFFSIKIGRKQTCVMNKPRVKEVREDRKLKRRRYIQGGYSKVFHGEKFQVAGSKFRFQVDKEDINREVTLKCSRVGPTGF